MNITSKPTRLFQLGATIAALALPAIVASPMASAKDLKAVGVSARLTADGTLEVSGGGHANAPHPFARLRTRCEWPSSRASAQQRDELASFQLIELHSMPASPGLGYRIGADQSAGVAGILQPISAPRSEMGPKTRPS